MGNPTEGTPNHPVENGEEILLAPGDSGNDLLNHGLDPIAMNSQDPLRHRRKH
ncbi:hypothetical protein RHMOL_Rhmol11G0011100 [Rhododendron molle]|uniref:Uncharacterized protein n=1 Tax=Rhododendron molle TaxID=49168 RepID=A0ACC0LMQ5_RHOML|nr:hypothetical protein RHMOL_Rhmol11G0011100 [Rhododendron molle]